MADKEIVDLTTGTISGASVIEFQLSAGGAGSSKKATFTALKTFTSDSPSLITPDLGTPSAGNLDNCNSLPVGALTGMGTGVESFLITPSSANLRGALTDETGSGKAVFATSPALITPDLGTPTAIELINAVRLSIFGRIVTGITDLIDPTDRGTGIVYTNATSCAITLPSTPSFFGDGFWFMAKAGGLGTATIVPNPPALIDGGVSHFMLAGESAIVVSLSGNFYTF